MSWSGRSVSQDEVPVVAVVSEGSAAATVVPEHYLSPTARRMAEMRGVPVEGVVDTFKRKVLKKTGHFDNIPLEVEDHVKIMTFSAEEVTWIDNHPMDPPLTLGATVIYQEDGRRINRFERSNQPLRRMVQANTGQFVEGDNVVDSGVQWKWSMETRPLPAGTSVRGINVIVKVKNTRSPPEAWNEAYQRRLATYEAATRTSAYPEMDDEAHVNLLFNVLLDPAAHAAMVLWYTDETSDYRSLDLVIQEYVVRSYLYDTYMPQVPELTISPGHHAQVRKTLYKANAQVRKQIHDLDVSH